MYQAKSILEYGYMNDKGIAGRYGTERPTEMFKVRPFRGINTKTSTDRVKQDNK